MCNRKVRIKVLSEKNELNIEVCQEQTLTEVLKKNNIVLPHICNGNGTCGKCKIRVVSGVLPITEADRRCLSEKELEQGIRLACKARIGEEGINESRLYSKSSEKAEHLCVEVIVNAEDDIIIEGIEKTKNTAYVIEGTEKTKNTTYVIEGTKKIKSTASVKEDRNRTEQNNYFIAIDIGTTTIAMALVNQQTGEICDTYTSLNHQRIFGADVLSRIEAANNGKAEELKQVIEEDLWQGICTLIQTLNNQNAKIKMDVEENVQNENVISQIIISGNTTMMHLLMGYSCEGLGRYPFVSQHLETIECDLKECLSLDKRQMREETENLSSEVNGVYNNYANTPITILPGISAFVGGDVVADLLVCPAFETEELSLLIDLGTNGEIVLGNKDKLLVTSTAAGPAFEGGNIACGTASVPGSISRVKIQNQRAIVKTIQDKTPPVGICGTGLISAISQLRQHNILDQQGGLQRVYRKQGYPLWICEDGSRIAIYQQDVREFQMAKSAIRAGIEILMEEYGCEADEISHVYLAGGFGVHLLEEDAIVTGILPKEFKEKIKSIGNGSLKGSIRYGMEMKAGVNIDKAQCEKQRNRIQRKEKVQEIINRASNISLAEKQNFQEEYLKFLNFDTLL